MMLSPLSLLNTRGLCNELAAEKVQSQTSDQLGTEELDRSKGLGMPKGHGHRSLASEGTKQLWVLCQLQHLLGFAPGWALSDSQREMRASNTSLSYKLKYWKRTYIGYQIRTSETFKNVFLILGFDGNENRIGEINETHLKWDIVSKVQWFFIKIYVWQVKTKRESLASQMNCQT